MKFRKKPLKSFNESIVIEGLGMKFKKKPIVIEAMQNIGLNIDELLEWCNGVLSVSYNLSEGLGAKRNLTINTLEGHMRVSLNDWIIKGVKGEFYPCKDDIFKATYEAVDAPPPPPDLYAIDKKGI